MHAELPVGAFVAALLVLVPLPWHWRACNVATVSIIAWLFVSNIVYAINSIIWAGNVEDSAPVWCDISEFDLSHLQCCFLQAILATKVQVGANMALPACCLCICIHLERIASVRQVCTSHSDKVRRMVFDGALCWAIPMIYMALRVYIFCSQRVLCVNHCCRLYCSRSPIWYRRRPRLSPHDLCVHTSYSFNLGTSHDGSCRNFWIRRYVLRHCTGNIPWHSSCSGCVTTFPPSSIDVRKTPSKLQLWFNHFTLYASYEHGSYPNDLELAHNFLEHVVLVSVWFETVDQLGECAYGLLSNCLLPCFYHSSLDAHVDLHDVVGCADI